MSHDNVSPMAQNFELLMTFYTPDEHVEASHSLVIISGEHSRPGEGVCVGGERRCVCVCRVRGCVEEGV